MRTKNTRRLHRKIYFLSIKKTVLNDIRFQQKPNNSELEAIIFIIRKSDNV